ncbi:aspartyl-phosphate phosphatase Spo0E family protein [Brevibacillus dissolubilis]|uniref:aspartyl-phosphate phosphatase Spo0E family protein n=1 Tax=Brevibacillus dissolubilis TaxID=1844116 RepID=UPI001117115C|nr:aspartyl-phosphate phosphatase Spo0E family protein [Brevibacillus dissolubilis]
MEELSNRIEMLRVKMVQTAMQKGSLVDTHVLELSQQLDELILKYQTAKGRKLAAQG